MNHPNRYALAGSVLDAYRVLRFNFSNPHSYTKFLQINSLRKKTGAKVFIEAGSYLGVTAGRCSKVFKQVHTIEIDPKLAGETRTYLAKKRNVSVVEGDALQELPRLMENPKLSKVLIFLDGHLSGDYQDSGQNAPSDAAAEPAVDILSLLAPHRDKISGIIVDDFRLFGTEGGFPSKSELLRGAEECFGSGFSLTVHLDQLLIRRLVA